MMLDAEVQHYVGLRTAVNYPKMVQWAREFSLTELLDRNQETAMVTVRGNTVLTRLFHQKGMP